MYEFLGGSGSLCITIWIWILILSFLGISFVFMGVVDCIAITKLLYIRLFMNNTVLAVLILSKQILKEQKKKLSALI